MRTGRICLLPVVAFPAVLCFVLPGWGAGFDRSQYDLIVAMKPFGERPKAPVGPAPGDKEIPQPPKVPFSATFKLTMIRRDDIVGEVCAMDDTKNPLWHAYLRVGESQDGIVVKEIDLDKQGVWLSKEGRDDEWLDVYATGTGVATAPARTGRSGTASVTPPRPSPPTLLFPPSVGGRKVDPGKLISPEEMQKHLEDYNMNLILSGGDKGPPLPIPLTPEQDQALVGAGVLSPPPE